MYVLLRVFLCIPHSDFIFSGVLFFCLWCYLMILLNLNRSYLHTTYITPETLFYFVFYSFSIYLLYICFFGFCIYVYNIIIIIDLFYFISHERSKLQNPNRMEVGFTAHFRNLISSGQYQFKGYLGRMPINTNGRYNITYSNVIHFLQVIISYNIIYIIQTVWKLLCIICTFVVWREYIIINKISNIILPFIIYRGRRNQLSVKS